MADGLNYRPIILLKSVVVSTALKYFSQLNRNVVVSNSDIDGLGEVAEDPAHIIES